MRLPDFEAWAIFAKVAQTGAFVSAANDLGLSKATVSKAVTRLEAQLGAALFHRTTRRLSLTQAGQMALPRAALILAEGEALDAEAQAQSTMPQGLVRMAAPMSFGLAHLAPAMPDFFALHPKVSVELNLADHQIDLVAEGFDLALRISRLEDSSMLARRLCTVRVPLVGSPGYFASRGRPVHPRDLEGHTALLYTNSPSPKTWRFEHPSEGPFFVHPASPLRVNNADFMRPALLAGLGLARQPDFMVWRDIADGVLEEALADWAGPPIGLHLVTPPSARRPARVEALISFLVERLAGAPWALV